MTEMVTITLMSGPQDGLQLSFDISADGGERLWLIGRGEDCDIVLSHDTQVSRAHARLYCVVDDDTMAEGIDENTVFRRHFRLEDVGSRNGTYVDDRRLRSEALDLLPGQLFRVGRTWLRVDS